MEVTLPSLIFHSEPHFEHRDAWVGGGGGGGGGELAKEVDFVFMFCYYFVQTHFVINFFLWFCLTCGLKN